MYRYLILLPLTLFFISCNAQQKKIAYCAYNSRLNSHGFENQGECGKFIDEDRFEIYPKHLKSIDFDEDNITTLYARNGKEGKPCVFYLSKTGKAVRSLFFDNGADYFEEGLSRTVSNKKIGFINHKLEVVIEPRFDFAYPFREGKAEVCNGCTQKQEGEHSRMVGGKWGVIDKSGKLISPLKE